MRWGEKAIIGAVLIAASIFVGGCAAKPEPADNGDAMVTTFAYEAAVSTALAFDPPVAMGQGPLALNRDERMPSAVLGYEDLTTEFFYIRIDDRFGDGWNNNYERRAITQMLGVRYR